LGSSYTGAVSVDGSSFTPASGIITVSLAAGSHTVKKVGTNYLFYMSVVYGTTGLINPEMSDVKMYPNPVQNSLFISSNEGVEKVEIFNLTGMLVQYNEGFVKTLDMSHLSKGSYIVKAYTAQGATKQMIIKE